MRLGYSSEVEKARVREGPYKSEPGDVHGAFLLKRGPVNIRVIASEGWGWEHVSVSTTTRTPRWSEMCWVKSLFFEDDEWVVQYHPAKADHINRHPFVLHMWRPQEVSLPKPPKEFV